MQTLTATVAASAAASASASATTNGAAVALPPLLALVDVQMTQLRSLMQEVWLARSVHVGVLQPACEGVATRAHAGVVAELERSAAEKAALLAQQRAQWEQLLEPQVRADTERLQTELQATRATYAQLRAAHSKLQEEVDVLSAAELIHGARTGPSSAPVAASLAGLPLKCLTWSLLPFLTKSDLARMCAVSFGWQQVLDRGMLWSRLCVRNVAAIVSAQKSAARAAEIKRINLAGLPQEFQTSNFLATIPAARHSLHSNLIAGSASGSASAPGGGSEHMPTPLTPQQLHSQIQVSISGPASAAAVAAAAAVVGSKHGGGAGGGAGAGAGGGPLSKPDMFALALKQLQKQVDPALSDFEDQSLKLASHHAIIQYLQNQKAEQKHKLGQQFGSAPTQHQLNSAQRKHTNKRTRTQRAIAISDLERGNRRRNRNDGPVAPAFFLSLTVFALFFVLCLACVCVCVHRSGVARIAHGAELDALRIKIREKDDLARAIQGVESRIAAEKALQAAAAQAEQDALRQERQAANLRKNFDAIIEQSLGSSTTEEEEQQAAAQAAATAAHAQAAAGASPDGSPVAVALTPAQEAAQTAASIALLKQQKKVLIKAVKSMAVELEQTRADKEDFTRKLHELQQKLRALDL